MIYPIRFLLFGLPCLLLGGNFAGLAQCQSPTTTMTEASALGDSLLLPYRLSKPDIIITLNDEALREVSGLGPGAKPGEFIAIADEKGEIFFIEGNKVGKVTNRVFFEAKGDFEGVEMVKNTLYAVQSNGKISEITHWEDTSKMVVKKYVTPLGKDNDIEGLCYDSRRNALLLSCKEDPEVPGTRNIWAFDLATKQLSAAPVYAFKSDFTHTKVPLTDADKRREFSPSGIAIHPISGDLYLLSSALKRLAVIDYTSGHLKYAARLEKELFPQPEGIAFDAAGNLYIGSEGKKSNGMLLRFSYEKGPGK